MSNHAYSKFWWQDWHGEPTLEMCSLASRGFWMELLCLAHSGEPYGHVTIGGVAPTTRQLARYCRTTEREVAALLKELEFHKVFDRTTYGVIFNRRMVNSVKKMEDGAKAAAKRWGNGPPNGSPNGPGNGQTTIDPQGNLITPLQKQKQRSEAEGRGNSPSPHGSGELALRVVGENQPNEFLRRRQHG
jgi:hypothetical protein